jgi:hypothetical protein
MVLFPQPAPQAPARAPLLPRLLLLLPLLLSACTRRAAACTTVMVGAAASADGSIIIARSDDGEEVTTTNNVMYHPPREGPALFRANTNSFSIELPGPGLAYLALPIIPADPALGRNASAEASGVNSAGGKCDSGLFFCQALQHRRRHRHCRRSCCCCRRRRCF